MNFIYSLYARLGWFMKEFFVVVVEQLTDYHESIDLNNLLSLVDEES